MPAKPKTPATKAPARRRVPRYSQSEIVRSAYLAGCGASAEEIADALGRPVMLRSVRELLRRHGFRLVQRTSAQTAFVTVISREAMAEIERISEPLGADPHVIAARVLERAAGDSSKLREIAKGVMGPPPAAMRSAPTSRP